MEIHDFQFFSAFFQFFKLVVEMFIPKRCLLGCIRVNQVILVCGCGFLYENVSAVG
jgi:hypothetical protein